MSTSAKVPPPRPATPIEAAGIIRAALEAEGLYTSQVESGAAVTITTKRPDHAPQMEIDVRYRGLAKHPVGEILIHYGPGGRLKIQNYGPIAMTSLAKRVKAAIDAKVDAIKLSTVPETIEVPEYLEAQRITDGPFIGRYRIRFVGSPPTLTEDQLKQIAQVLKEAE